MEAAGRRDDLAVVNPSAILGPLLDDDPGISSAFVGRLLDGSIPAAPRLRLGGVDVRDVAQLQLRAMEVPAAGGHRFLASAGTLSFIEAARILRAAFPERAGRLPRFVLPDWVVRLYGLFDPDVRANLGSLGRTRPTDASAAEALLGHAFIPPADAAIATARSLIERRLL